MDTGIGVVHMNYTLLFYNQKELNTEIDFLTSVNCDHFNNNYYMDSTLKLSYWLLLILKLTSISRVRSIDKTNNISNISNTRAYHNWSNKIEIEEMMDTSDHRE